MRNLTKILLDSCPILAKWLLKTSEYHNNLHEISYIEERMNIPKETKLHKKTKLKTVKLLTDEYHTRIFQRSYGFRPLAKKLNAYLAHCESIEVSQKTYGKMYRLHYLEFSNKIVKLVKPNKYIHLITLGLFILTCLTITQLFYAAFLTSKLLLTNYQLLMTLGIVIAALVTAIIAACKLFDDYISPYHTTINLLKKGVK